MNRKANQICAALVAVAFGATVANAQVVGGSFDDRYYEIVPSQGIPWADAAAAARLEFYDYGAGDPRGIVQGRLATITSEAEDIFIESLRGSATLAKPEVWVGAAQEDGATAPGDGWRWLNGESIAAVNTSSPYTNWQAGEPNDSGGEIHIGVGHSGTFGWNDEGRNGNIGGYVIEYGDTTDGSVCVAGVLSEGCPLEGGTQFTQLPANIDLPPNPTLTTKLELFTDPRVDSNGDCTDRRKLDVYGELVPQPDPRAQSLILGKFQCGSPNFAVLKVDSNIDVIQGVVESEQFPEIVPGIGNVYACDGGGDLDLQHRSIFGYQTDNRFDLIENLTIDVTDGCGSSRGKHRALSFFVLNLHTDCGITNGDTNAIRHCFRGLTLGKFVNFGKSLKDSRSELNSPSYRQLLLPYYRAKIRFLFGRYDGAIAQLETFLSRVDDADFDTISGINYQGDLIMRAENLIFDIEKIRDAP